MDYKELKECISNIPLDVSKMKPSASNEFPNNINVFINRTAKRISITYGKYTEHSTPLRIFMYLHSIELTYNGKKGKLPVNCDDEDYYNQYSFVEDTFGLDFDTYKMINSLHGYYLEAIYRHAWRD